MISVAKSDFWEPCGYAPHPGQEKIHNHPARHRLAACGRRFGKSRLGGMELVPLAFEAYGIRGHDSLSDRRYYWIVGPTYDDAEKEWRVFWDTCKRLEFPFDKPGTYNNTEGGEMRMSLWDSMFIVECKSAQHPEGLVGEGLSGVELVEAAKLKPSVWTKYIRPALADKRGWSLHTSTPEGKNWFYDLWQRGQDPLDPDWQSWRMPSWENPIIFPGGRNDPEILDMASDMSAEKFGQEIGADFTDFVGRVFKDFDEEIHVKDLQYDPRYPLYAASDYGWTNPFVWIVLQVDVWDNVYVLGEYRVQQKDINDIARDLMNWKGGINSKVKRFYPDPAEPGDTAVLSKALKIPYGTNTGGELKWRLEQIRQHLKLLPEHVPEEERKPRLYIDRSCSRGIFEMLEYRFPESKEESLKAEPEAPLKKDDHFPEALGRFFRGYFGGPAEEKARVAVRRARMDRGMAVHR